MKRFFMPVSLIVAGISILGLTTAGTVTAQIERSASIQSGHVHVINLHAAYEARLRQLKDAALPPIAGIVHPKSPPPSPGRGGTSCGEPYCPVYYYNGPVQVTPHVYLVLWGPNWSSDPGQEATASYLESFYSGLGRPGDTWSTTTSQYGDSEGGNPTFGSGVYEGVFHDTNPPPKGATQKELAAEADAFTKSQGITDLTDAQIVLATQSGTCPLGFAAPSCPKKDQGNYCSWHSNSNEPYTNLPYVLDAGTICGKDAINPDGTYDGFSMVGGHEYAESITDPFPFTGWYDPNDISGGEIADKCAWSPQSSDVKLATGTFAMQPLWSNAAYAANLTNGCVMSTTQTGDITMNNPGTQSDYHAVMGIGLQLVGTSSHGYQLAWSATGLPSGLTINSSGLISGQAKGVPGTYNVTVSASDSTGTASVGFEWEVLADVGSTVTNKGSGLCLNDSHWVTTPGNEIFLWHCGKSPPEDFSHPANKGELIVFGQCMTDPHAARGAGQLQKIYPCTGAKDQEWYLNSKGEYILQANSLCLTDPADATQNGTPVVVEKCTDATDQQWLGS